MFKWLKNFCNNKPKNKLMEYFDSKYRGVTLTVNQPINLNSLSKELSINCNELKEKLLVLAYVKYTPSELNRPKAVDGKSIRTGIPEVDSLIDHTVPAKPDRFEIIADEFNKYYKR